MKNNYNLILFLLILILSSCVGKSNFTIPDSLKNKRIHNVIIPAKWVEISSDNILTYHLHINNSGEDFEFKAKIGEYNDEESTFALSFIGKNTYQGRNDYKPSEILPKLEIREGDNDIRMYVVGFNTIKGKSSEEMLIFR